MTSVQYRVFECPCSQEPWCGGGRAPGHYYQFGDGDVIGPFDTYEAAVSGAEDLKRKKIQAKNRRNR